MPACADMTMTQCPSFPRRRESRVLYCSGATLALLLCQRRELRTLGLLDARLRGHDDELIPVVPAQAGIQSALSRRE